MPTTHSSLEPAPAAGRLLRVATTVLALSLLAGTPGCSSLFGTDDEAPPRPLSHPWLEEGRRFVYDFVPVRDDLQIDGLSLATTDSALILTVVPSFYAEARREGRLDLAESFPRWQPHFGNADGHLRFRMETRFSASPTGLLRQPDGLSVRRHCSTTPGGILSCWEEEIVFPANPVQGARIPDTDSQHPTTRVFQVAAADSVVEVPAGSFEVYEFRELRFPARENEENKSFRHYYVSEREGIVRIELEDPEGPIGHYELARIERP